MISADCFIESAYGSYVLFIEGIDSDVEHARDLFVTNAEQGKVGVAVTKTGEFKTTPSGDHFIVFDEGRRYEDTPGRLDYRIVGFGKYGAEIANKPPRADTNLPTKSRSMKGLLADPAPENLDEPVWWIGPSLLTLNSVLITIPLAYISPRLGRYTLMIFVALIYLTYPNLLNLSQVWVSQGKMNVFMVWWPIYLAALICAVLLFRFRHYSATGLKGISTPLGFTPKKMGA